MPELLKGVTEAYEGITVEAFEQAVQQFFATVTQPTLGLPDTRVGYRPMRELLALLEAHDVTTYICSGGGRDFMRPVSEQMYGISVLSRQQHHPADHRPCYLRSGWIGARDDPVLEELQW